MYACGHCDFTSTDGLEANKHEDTTGHVVDELGLVDDEDEDPDDPDDYQDDDEDEYEDEELSLRDDQSYKNPVAWEAALDRADLDRKRTKGE